MDVVCRFKVESLQERVDYGTPRSLVGVVNMNAVQSEPFGKYTPWGTIQMAINNPAAYEVFKDALKASVEDSDCAVFEVTFKRIK